MITGKTYIIVLNWNGWPNTIECIESLLKSDCDNYQIVVVDNNSDDGSISNIVKYLSNQLKPFLSPDKTIRDMMMPFHDKAIPFIIYDEQEANTGGDAGREIVINKSGQFKYPVIIIKNTNNYGFAKGNNTALKFCLCRADFHYVWLVNNDAIVEARALSSLVREAEIHERAGIVGSVIRYYDNPSYIQTIGGGKFYPWLGVAKLHGKKWHISTLNVRHTRQITKNINYIMGASLLIKKDTLGQIGLFDENFFLFTEEVDLAYRAVNAGWTIAVAMDSVIYHKESASTKDRKYLYHYYKNKSEIYFLLKQYGGHYVCMAIPFKVLYIFFSSFDTRYLLYTIRGVKDGLRSCKKY